MLCAFVVGLDEPINRQYAVDAAQSLLIVIPSLPTNPGYEEFALMVDVYNSQAPFNWPNEMKERFGVHVPKTVSIQSSSVRMLVISQCALQKPTPDLSNSL